MWNLRGKAFATGAAALLMLLTFSGCNRGEGNGDGNEVKTYQMGEKVQFGQLTYSVLDAQWKPALSDAPDAKPPKDRYLIVRLSATNSGNAPVSLNAVELKGRNGQTYPEVMEGAGELQNHLGLFRELPPSRTETGVVVFDAPPGPYKLLLSDGKGDEDEKVAEVEIPVPIQ